MSFYLVFGDAFTSIELIDHQLHYHVFLKEVERSSFVYSALNGLFLLGSLDNSFFDGAFGHQLINIDVSALTNSMSSVCSLGVHCGIPVVIVEDDSVSCCKSDSKST